MFPCTLQGAIVNKTAINREMLYELFILCLFWQWNPARLTHCWTTGGKVLRILQGLGILSEAQVKWIPQDSLYQSLFATRSLYVTTPAYDFKTKEEPGGKRSFVLDDPRQLTLIQVFKGKAPNRKRILLDYRIYLTHLGASASAGLEEKYKDLLTREMYFAEIKKQEEQISSPAARAAISKRYRARILNEVGE